MKYNNCWGLERMNQTLNKIEEMKMNAKIQEKVKGIPKKVPRWIIIPISVGKTGIGAIITIELLELFVFLFLGAVTAFTLHFWFTVAIAIISAAVYGFGIITKSLYLMREDN